MAYNTGGFAGGCTLEGEDDLPLETWEDDFDLDDDDLDDDDLDDDETQYPDSVAEFRMTGSDLLDTLESLNDDVVIDIMNRYACLGALTLARIAPAGSTSHEWGVENGEYRDSTGKLIAVTCDQITEHFIQTMVNKRVYHQKDHTAREMRTALRDLIATRS